MATEILVAFRVSIRSGPILRPGRNTEHASCGLGAKSIPIGPDPPTGRFEDLARGEELHARQLQAVSPLSGTRSS